MCSSIYCIYLAIRQDFPFSGITTNTKPVLQNYARIRFLPFLNNPKDLDPSYKMDLGFWDCFGGKKLLSYIRRNMVCVKLFMKVSMCDDIVLYTRIVNSCLSL